VRNCDCEADVAAAADPQDRILPALIGQADRVVTQTVLKTHARQSGFSQRLEKNSTLPLGVLNGSSGIFVAQPLDPQAMPFCRNFSPVTPWAPIGNRWASSALCREIRGKTRAAGPAQRRSASWPESAGPAG